jgi:hypothetical protein
VLLDVGDDVLLRQPAPRAGDDHASTASLHSGSGPPRTRNSTTSGWRAMHLLDLDRYTFCPRS